MAKSFRRHISVLMAMFLLAGMMLNCNRVSGNGIGNNTQSSKTTNDKVQTISTSSDKTDTPYVKLKSNETNDLTACIVLPDTPLPSKVENNLGLIVESVQSELPNRQTQCSSKLLYKCGHFKSCSCVTETNLQRTSLLEDTELGNNNNNTNENEISLVEALNIDRGVDLDEIRETNSLEERESIINRYLCQNSCLCTNKKKCVKIVISGVVVGSATFCLMAWLLKTGYLASLGSSITSGGISSLVMFNKGVIIKALKPYTDVTLINFDCGNCCQHCSMQCKDTQICSDLISCCSAKCDPPKCIIM